MNDPVRLLDGGADEFEAELLRAGRADAMSAHSRKQILAGIGIGGLLTASTVASGVRAAAKGWLTTFGAGTVSVVAIWVGVHAVTSKPAAAPVPVAAKVSATTAARVPDGKPTPADVTPTAEPEPDRAPISAVAVPKPLPRTPANTDSSLAAELSALEQARSAFLGHDYTQALRLLDDYAHRFPKQKLGSEATVLRIESLAGRGDRDSAARVGHDFLQNHPNGPYAQRVRSVIGEGSASARTP
jgi:TolA-binding protein